MKRLLVSMFACLVLDTHAQAPSPNLSWTFPWGNTWYGLLFEDSELTDGVKTAIRDDVQGVLSYNPQTNATFSALSPEDLDFGRYDGHITFSNSMLPSGFPLFHYKAFNGTNYFAVTIENGSNYVAKVAFTNQYKVEISGLSNFLHTAQNMATTNTTIAEFQQKWWNPIEEKVPMPENVSADSLRKYITDLGGLYYYYPSILAIETVTYEGKSWLGCKVWTQKKGSLTGYLEMDLVYGGGCWRFVPFVW